MQRWQKIVGILAVVAVLASVGASAQAARTTRKADPIKVGIIYSRTGASRRLRRRVHPGPPVRPRVRDEGHEQGQRPQDRAHDRRRRHRPGQGRLGRQGPDRPGLQDHRRQRRRRASRLQVAPLAAQNKVLFISGPAATDAITGINRYTFRSGRQSIPGRRSTARIVPRRGRRQEGPRLRAGLGVRRRATSPRSTQLIGGRRPHGRTILVPLSATDFTPFAQQVKQPKPDLLFVAWAGTTAPAMWRALDQQGVFDSVDDGRRPASPSGRRGPPSGRSRTTSRSSRTTSRARRRTRSTTGSSARCASAARCRTSSRRTASSRRR